MQSGDHIGLRKIERALVSVYDKSGVVEFARALSREFGVELLSTGGTADLLRGHDIAVTLVEDETGVGEMLDGRVKTLHPKIHAAILADRDNPDHMRQLGESGIKPIDMVVVNLYPFEDAVAKPDCTRDEAVEMIDIGGPCMLRAAAKNHRSVLPVCNVQRYDHVLRELRERDGCTAMATRAEEATRVFARTARYDSSIREYFEDRSAATSVSDGPRENIAISLSLEGVLRYGENPHQEAGLWKIRAANGIRLGGGRASLVGVEQRSGEAMSYNNYVDADSALALCSELKREVGGRSLCVCVYVKHTNACGVGVAVDAIEAYRKAYLGDPNAAMGGVLVCSFAIDREFATAVMESLARWGKEAGAGAFFVEVWVAPAFADEAVSAIREAKPWGRRVRLLPVGEMGAPIGAAVDGCRQIAGGMLVQSSDDAGLDEDCWQVVTRRRPSESELPDLRLAWLTCKHTKSNAITICGDGMLLGNGAGQMSRVLSCRIATMLAKENGHGESLDGAVAASDAFFPFRDGPDRLMADGVRAIIQPGGSKRDQDSITACDEHDVAMVFARARHFRH